MVRWPAESWEKKAKLSCVLFGHKVEGYAGGAPYLRAQPGAVGGIGRLHISLMAKCEKCGTTGMVAMTHGPIPYPWDNT